MVEQFAQGDSEVSVLGDAETWLKLIPKELIQFLLCLCSFSRKQGIQDLLSQQGQLEDKGKTSGLGMQPRPKQGLNLGNWGGLYGNERNMHVVAVYKQHTCRRSRAHKVELSPVQPGL